MNGHWSDWLFWIGGWTLTGVGALLLLWALIGDRSRGRRRCRKCWYDMESIDAVDGVWTCPECGKRATRKKLLLKPHRRWRWAVLASLLILVAYPVGVVPVVRQSGWVRAVPSSVLVFIAPVESEDILIQQLWGVPYCQLRPQTSLLKELLSRAEDGELAGWQYQILIDRLIGTEPLFLRGGLMARESWPVDEPLIVELIFFDPVVWSGQDWMLRVRARGGSKWIVHSHFHPWGISAASLGDADLGTFQAGTVELEGELHKDVAFVRNGRRHDMDLADARVVWRGSLGQVEISGAPRDHIVPYDTPAARQAVAGLIKGVTTNSDWRPQLVLEDASTHIDDGVRVDWGLGFYAEILVEDRVVAEGSGLYRMMPKGPILSWHSSKDRVFDLEWTADPMVLDEGSVMVRLSDDPRMAIKDLTRTVFWSGEVTVRVGVPDE